MSQYYQPRPSQRANLSTPAAASTSRVADENTLQVNLEDSRYVFPNPSSSVGSAPTSPSLGSELSMPTDISVSHVSELRSRESSVHGSRTRSRRRRSSLRSPTNIGRRFSVGTDGDPEVEIWDWNADTDSMSMALSEESSVDLEEELERAQRWELLSHKPAPSHRHPVSSSSLWRARQWQLETATARPSPPPPSDALRRHRSFESDPGPIAPKPHKHIPMLSFIASLLLIDEATIRLLTHAPSDSILFPGHSLTAEDGSSDEDGEASHGAVKLFAGSEDHQCLREGLATACDADFFPFNPFGLSGLRLNGLLRLVNGVWTTGGRALREVWM